MEKIFLLGVGAQKAGTSWLHDYLNSHPQSDMGFIKEYHIFDAISVPETFGFRERLEKDIIELTQKGFSSWSNSNIVMRYAFMSNPKIYFSYFTDLLRKNEIKLTGDVTPSYSALSTETLKYIKNNFEDRGVSVRPIFLMRDPVKRLNSAIKMRFRNRGVEASYEKEISAMKEMCGSASEKIRADYKSTIKNLEKVFSDNIYLGFYEELFSEKSCRSICDYLGVDYIAPNLEKKVNQSISNNKLTEEDLRYFSEFYLPQFEYCAERFGEDRVQNIWKSFSF